MTGTLRMPPFRGIMAVDAVGFSRNRSSDLPDLSASIPDLLARTFERCAARDLEDAHSHKAPDGYLRVAHDDAPYLIDPLLDELQRVLEEQDQALQAKSRDLRLRLRSPSISVRCPTRGTPAMGSARRPTTHSGC